MAEPRAIWSGTISFVLVNIPVQLFTATESETINFDLLHKKDNSRIRYARFCKSEEKEVPYEEITRGYEFRKGEYVIVTTEDFQKADPKKTKSIEILDFVNLDEIDPIYFAHPYYLAPTDGSEKSFSLFMEALNKAKKVAVAKFVMREREHLAVLRPHDNVILLQQMHFAREIRPAEKLVPALPAAEKKELDLALSLIEKLSSDFKIENFQDTYYETLKRIIDEKSKGQAVHPVSTEPTATEFEDLMAKLKESLEKTPASK